MGWDITVEDVYERVGAEWGTTSQPTAQQATKKNTGTKRHLCPKKSCRNTRRRQQGLRHHFSSPWEKVVSLLNAGEQAPNSDTLINCVSLGGMNLDPLPQPEWDSICHLCSASERTNEEESGLHRHHGIGGQRNSLGRSPFHQPTEISIDSERSSSFSLRVEQETCNLKVRSCGSLFM